MLAFDDNPFAEEEEEEEGGLAAAHVDDVSSRKRSREEDVVVADPTCIHAPPQRDLPAPPPTVTPAAKPPTLTPAISSNGGIEKDLLQKEPFALTDPVGVVELGSPLIEISLTEYNERQEEDEFHTLLLKATRLDSEVKQQEKTHADELERMSRKNRDLRQSVEGLRAEILRLHEEAESVQRVEETADGGTEASKNNEALLVLGNIEAKSELVEQKIARVTERLLAQDTDGVVVDSIRERLTSCLMGTVDVLPPDLTAFDSENEEDCFLLCEEAVNKLRTGMATNIAIPLVEALLAEFRELVTRYNTTYITTKKLRDRVVCGLSSLRELTKESLDWCISSSIRALNEGSDAVPPMYTETQEVILDNQQLETTLSHLESAIHKLLPVPNAVEGSRQNAPSIAVSSGEIYCQELESHIESLGKEVLRLRKLVTTDAATLLQMIELEKTQVGGGGGAKETKQRRVSMKNEWLTTLMNTLLERLNSANTLWNLLTTSTKSRNAPAVELQLAFYQRYINIQESLLRLLCSLNSTLQDRAHIVSVIRQAVLHDCDEAAVGVLVEKMMIQESENNMETVHEELEQICTETVQQFEQETSELLQEEEKDNINAAQEGTRRLLEVRNFFAQTLQTIDRLVYGSTPTSGAFQKALNNTLRGIYTETDGTPLQLNLNPPENGGEAIIQLASEYHEEELLEEISAFQRRNLALEKCLKWLSMQPSYSATLQLRSIHKEIEEVKAKLATFSESEAKWAALKGELETVMQKESILQNASAERKDKLNDLRGSLYEKTEVESSSIAPAI